ncbi:MAG TPA: hypothetical protein DCZ94_07930 [Lentisphaeria bacterium]|nr:MAG: hypothetical protein A2X48_24330 [Lentisphaerae bacterium GWF2_49_21]HBC86866.1 hypothetical protein [Lentisphaeria bacterium]
MKRSQAYIFLCLVTILLANLLIFSFFNHAFDDDEFQHVHIAWLLHHGYIPYKDFFEHHLVFYHRLTAPLFVFGENFRQIFFFRGISMISAAGALFLLYRCGRSFGFSPIASGTGTWLLGITPMFLLKMTEARPEALAIFAFTGALSLMFAPARADSCRPGKSAESPEILTRRIQWKFIFIGLLAGAMALLSQKYVIAAGALLAAIYFLNGWKPAVITASAFCASVAAYSGWMLAIGAGNNAFESVILLNLRWKYSFSPSGYFVELYTTAGILFVTGVFGILRALFQGHTRRQAFALATLLAGCLLQIFLVPVPYRQSFLPLLVILALGSMFFSASIFQLATVVRRGWAIFAIPLLLGASSLAALPRQLSADNRADISQMKEIAKFAPSGPVFDGRGLMFHRMHVGYHACMHHEILMMLDADKYSEDVIRSLQDAGMPPVIRDYRVQKMPDMINSFISDNYLPSTIPGVLTAGLSRERLVPKKPEVMNIRASGTWKATWRGGKFSIDGEPIVNGQIIILERGSHILVSENLSWDFRIERSY